MSFNGICVAKDNKDLNEMNDTAIGQNTEIVKWIIFCTNYYNQIQN